MKIDWDESIYKRRHRNERWHGNEWIKNEMKWTLESDALHETQRKWINRNKETIKVKRIDNTVYFSLLLPWESYRKQSTKMKNPKENQKIKQQNNNKTHFFLWNINWLRNTLLSSESFCWKKINQKNVEKGKWRTSFT